MPDSEEGTRSSHLTREDWVDAAWKALANGSIETIKVDRLAHQLNVTRGSFYWHFKDKKDLIDAVLDRWLGRLGFDEVIAPQVEKLDSPEDKLWAIQEYVIRNIDGPQSIFLRVMARRSKQIYRRMMDEDQRRIEHHSALFREIGFDEVEAHHRAEIHFGMMMSEFLRNGNLSLTERLARARRQHDLVVRMPAEP